MNRERKPVPDGLLRVALGLLVAAVFAALAYTLVWLPPIAPGLSEAVDAALPDSGIPNPVTATLLDFRSYDTLLEIAVLLLAATTTLATARGRMPAFREDDEILAFFARMLVPVMILIAGYLLAAGFDAPGGAFQAGAVLAAVGILRLLAGQPLPLRDDALPVRFALVIGLALFVAAGIMGMVAAGAFLDHPASYTPAIVLVLEIGVAVSVAIALLSMFVGVLRDASGTQDR